MLTQEDLKQIATTFNLTMPALFKVKDGFVQYGDEVWWSALDGPENVIVNGFHIDNIKNHPHLYSIDKPRYKIEYLT